MIFYTETDEAPMLATLSLFPIVKKFLNKAGVEISTRNISLAHRILAAASDFLPQNQRVEDDLKYLADLCLKPEANIIKLPNISASVAQMKAAIAQLRQNGFDLPEYPDSPQNETEEKIKNAYAAALGSAVNPVIREGNSDRRAPKSVKNYAKKNPYKVVAWDKNSKTKVLSMTDGDFYASEKSYTNGEEEKTVKFVFTNKNGVSKELRPPLKLLAKEILDCSAMSEKSLKKFVALCMETARNEKLLFSFHLKATMMKVSDPIIFGTILKTFSRPSLKNTGKFCAKRE